MTQRHGIYSVPLPISGKKLAASVVTLAAIWRSGRDSNPRVVSHKLISSFIKCVSGSVSFVSVPASFVLAAKPHKHWIFHIQLPKKPVISGKLE